MFKCIINTYILWTTQYKFIKVNTGVRQMDTTTNLCSSLTKVDPRPTPHHWGAGVGRSSVVECPRWVRWIVGSVNKRRGVYYPIYGMRCI